MYATACVQPPADQLHLDCPWTGTAWRVLVETHLRTPGRRGLELRIDQHVFRLLTDIKSSDFADLHHDLALRPLYVELDGHDGSPNAVLDFDGAGKLLDIHHC